MFQQRIHIRCIIVYHIINRQYMYKIFMNPWNICTNYGMIREGRGISFMANGEFHTLCTHNNTKMADQVVIKFTRIAHRTQKIHRNIVVRIDNVITCPLLVVPTRHLWFPLTRGNWWGGALLFVQLFAWTNCWTNIQVAGGLRRHRSHFHSWNFDRLSYSFGLERWFVYSLQRRSFTRTMVHTCTVSVCRRTDRRTDNVQAITNIPLPPSQKENGIAIATNVIWC